MLWKRSKRVREAIERGQAQRDYYAKIAADAGFEITRYENGTSFGNIVIELRRRGLLLQFVRDKGYAFCEARSTAMRETSSWVEYDAVAKMRSAHTEDLHDDFDMLYKYTLEPENAQAIDALEQMAESWDY